MDGKKMSMEMLEIKQKMESLSDEKLTELYSLANEVSMDTIEELCPALLRICLEDDSGALKNQLGMVIFHLQKNERTNTRIGLEKLLHGALKVNPEEVFKLLESSEPDAKELSKRIKKLL
ncbi:MAG: hypothetical protein EU550_01695 [Promethearchaeota archaeon]|nr:MAG: hypothetical protein EU550_01695 [Candidatus Lokiarchaeota archaeon]